MSIGYCLNCLGLLVLALFYLSFLRGLGKWGVLLFAFAVALFGGVSMAEWSGHPEYTPLVFLAAVLVIALLWLLDKLIAGVLFGADSVLAFFRSVTSWIKRTQILKRR